MRLFIAIDLPEEIKEYMRKLQALLVGAKMSNRPSRSEATSLTRPEGATLTNDFHLTLKFLGSCEENRRKRVETSLSKIPFQPFEATLESIGVFGGKQPPGRATARLSKYRAHRAHPRVVWVGIKVPPWLCDTVAEIENRMHELGFEKEHRFTPHITLARIKFIENPKAFLDALKKIPVEPLKFPVEHFYLFESQLSSNGAVHIKLAAFPQIIP